jgi:hypothetical protein
VVLSWRNFRSVEIFKEAKTFLTPPPLLSASAFIFRHAAQRGEQFGKEGAATVGGGGGGGQLDKNAKQTKIKKINCWVLPPPPPPEIE